MSDARVKMRAILRAFAVTALTLVSLCRAEETATLPSTAPLTWEEADLSERLMNGAHTFVERKIADAKAERSKHWLGENAVERNRALLKEITGVVDDRLRPRMERFGDDDGPALLADMPNYQVFRVRWAVLDGFSAEGLLVEPRGNACGNLVVLPDAGQALTEASVAVLAKAGFRIVIPTLINSEKLETEDPQIQRSDQTHREWLYRQAFHMGRHVIGYELQEVLAAVDWFVQRDPDGEIGVLGYNEGGLLAFYAAAMDPRIDAAFVSGYFNSREAVWKEPIYRNVWSLLRTFGDAEIASLILPRKLIIEHSAIPAVVGHKGELITPEIIGIREEVARITQANELQLVTGADGATTGPWSNNALLAFAEAFGVTSLSESVQGLPIQENTSTHRRVFKGIENHVQGLVRASEHVRDDFFLHAVMPEFKSRQWNTLPDFPTHAPDKFVEGAKAYRQKFLEEGMGQFDEPMGPANPRTRKILENDRWTAYDVVLDVYPELFAWGVLVLPRNMKPGEKRPVVVVQHGRNGLPRKLIDKETTGYDKIAAKLAERGFIVFVPHNLYRGEDRYRWLDRKANTIKATLFSFIITQHDQILNWLDTLPNVDGDRIAFYGLSYGGETAVRVPPILEKYCLSICSGDFNQWTRKVASTDQPFSFMRTIEWEMPYWNLGHTFDYAEMTYLMVPRPFMVERGHHDYVSKDRWVAHEYAKVRWLYAQLGLADRTEITYFQGGHSMKAEESVRFLHKHLDWPEP
ncbi:MAG: dienelactone hydrolase [Verrucomicrobiales bacterium]|jgi:dienelactone hydrolase